MFTFSIDSLFLNSTIADNVGVVVSSVTMIGPRLETNKISLVNTPFGRRSKSIRTMEHQQTFITSLQLKYSFFNKLLNQQEKLGLIFEC